MCFAAESTDLVLRQRHILTMLLVVLLCILPLQTSSQPTISPSPSPASPQSAPSPSAQADTGSGNDYFWIVQGNSTGKVVPNCSDLCVTEIGNSDFQVILGPCEGLSPSEEWRYDQQLKKIVSKIGTPSGVQLCLDANDPNNLQLISCDGSSTQIWQHDSEKMRFQGGNSSSQGSPLYLMGEIRHASDWGTGKNNYSLQLASEESMIGGKGDFSSVFTLIPVINPLSVAPPRLEVSPLGESIVTNGGFEECNDDPGKGFVTIDNTQPLYLCSWFVTTNEVEYSGTNLWPPKGGTHSLHLNSAKIAMPASVVQRVPTNNSSNYTLGFYMAGNPDVGCGSSNKTMRVTVTPSSLGMQEFWFDVSNAAEGENWYMEVYPIGFTAYADYVNLTYTSLTSGSCGPVIDNVSMVEIQGALPPLVDPHKAYSLLISGSSSSGGIPKYGEALIAITASSLVVIAGALLFTWIVKKAKKKRGNFNHPSTRRKTMRDKLAAIIDGMHPNNGGKHIPAMSVPQARWWSSINLQQEGGERFKGDAMAVIELSWKQIEKATNNFTTIVGEGGFSTVYRAQLGNGVLGAVKMEKTRDRSRQLFKQELSVLCRLRHPNLVNLLGFCNERDEGILVFEYMAHGSLHQRLHPPAHQLYVPLSWEKRLEVATQIAQGLRYLHDIARPPVVHGDVKSANVLLDDDDNAKICDFGFSLKGGPNSSVFHSTVASVKGSLGYLDPQYLKNGRLSSKSDVYSFGVLLMELVTGFHAFDLHRAETLTSFAAPYIKDLDMMELIVDSRLSGKYDIGELRTVCNVARSCVQEDSASRPTMSEVIVRLSASSVSLSSTTTDQQQVQDTNASSSLSESLGGLDNCFDSDFLNSQSNTEFA